MQPITYESRCPLPARTASSNGHGCRATQRDILEVIVDNDWIVPRIRNRNRDIHGDVDGLSFDGGGPRNLGKRWLAEIDIFILW